MLTPLSAASKICNVASLHLVRHLLKARIRIVCSFSYRVKPVKLNVSYGERPWEG